MEHTSLDILDTLIGIRSINGDYAANHEGVEYIDQFLRTRGMIVKRYEFNGVESLVATTRPTKTPAVMLCGHLDVVPGDDTQFTLQKEDGKLIGRGVVDMKSAIASYLQLVDNYQDHLQDYDFGIMIVTDEESGGHQGTVRLLAEGYAPKMCVIPDGGRDWALEALAKGMWIIDVTVSGVSAHGSRPWEGDSAIERLMHLLREIVAIFPAKQDRNTSTCTISQIQAGEARNQVPANATATLDIRLASIEDAKNITNAVNIILEAHGGSISNVTSGAPCVHDLEHPYLRSFADSMQKTLGYPPGTTISQGASDARYFAAKGIPCAVFYPTGGGHHGPTEWITEESYKLLQQVLDDFLQKEALTKQ